MPCLRGYEGAEHVGTADEFGLGAVAGGLHEHGELCIGHTRRVDMERADDDLPYRPLTIGRERVLVLAAHQERATGDGHHASKDVGRPAHGDGEVRRGRAERAVRRQGGE